MWYETSEWNAGLYFGKAGFSCGVTKRNFLRRENAEYGVSTSFPLKSPRPWKSRREQATECLLQQQQQQQLVKCEIVMDRCLLPALPIRLTSTRSNIRLATFQPSSSSSHPSPPSVTSVYPAHETSLDTETATSWDFTSRWCDTVPSTSAELLKLHATPCHHALFASHHYRISDFPDYIVRVSLRKMCTLVLFWLCDSRAARFPKCFDRWQY